jgi:hypothetical protein
LSFRLILVDICRQSKIDGISTTHIQLVSLIDSMVMYHRRAALARGAGRGRTSSCSSATLWLG